MTTGLALVPLGAVGCVSKSEYTKTVQAAEAHYNAFDAENTGLKHELAAAGKRRETVVANGGFRVGQISSMLSHPGHLERAARTEFGSSGRCAVGRLVTESPVRHPRPGGDGMIERDESIASSDSDTLHWILRIAVAACFIGHGAFGLITKAAWLPYFAILGIPEAWAWKLMPVVGAVDVSVGVLTLIQPVRAAILYMTFWGFQTACLRPLAGQGVWELLERAGNYGVPLAFLYLLGAGRSPADWFSFRPGPPLTIERASAIGWILRATTALLLIGHGGFDFAMGKSWTSYGAVVGISPTALAAHPLSPTAGWFECVLGLIVLCWPMRGVLLFVFAWKLATETFRPLAGEPIWEFIERGGSYGAPLALLWLQRGYEAPARVAHLRASG